MPQLLPATKVTIVGLVLFVIVATIAGVHHEQVSTENAAVKAIMDASRAERLAAERAEQIAEHVTESQSVTTVLWRTRASYRLLDALGACCEGEKVRLAVTNAGLCSSVLILPSGPFRVVREFSEQNVWFGRISGAESQYGNVVLFYYQGVPSWFGPTLDQHAQVGTPLDSRRAAQLFAAIQRGLRLWRTHYADILAQGVKNPEIAGCAPYDRIN